MSMGEMRTVDAASRTERRLQAVEITSSREIG